MSVPGSATVGQMSGAAGKQRPVSTRRDNRDVRGRALLALVLLVVGSCQERPSVGAWSAELLPDPALAEQPARLTARYTPWTINTTRGPEPVEVTARCTDCGSSVGAVHITVCPPRCGGVAPNVAPTRGPDAVLAFTGDVVFPAAGTWELSPFGVAVRVRSTASSDPAVVRVVASDQAACADAGARLIPRFVEVFDNGDLAELAQLISPRLAWFTRDSRPYGDFFSASDLATLATYASERRRAGEQSRLFNLTIRGAEATFVLTRRAADLGGERIVFGKAEIDCVQYRIAKWSDSLGAP